MTLAKFRALMFEHLNGIAGQKAMQNGFARTQSATEHDYRAGIAVGFQEAAQEVLRFMSDDEE